MLILGNVIMFAASVLMLSVGLIKDNKMAIVVQTIQIAMMAIGNLLLGSIPGTIVNAVSIVRNLLCCYGKIKKWNKIAVIAASTSLSLIFNNIGLIGLLPIVSMTVFTLGMNTKSPKTMKFLIIGTSVLWAIHDTCVQAYVATGFDILTIVTAIIGLRLLRKEKQNNEKR